MCFGKKEKQDTSAPAPRPVALPQQHQSAGSLPEPKTASVPHSNAQQQQHYAPPPGPPPSQSQSQAAAATSGGHDFTFAPPPGPPPSQASQPVASGFTPPPGLPPGRAALPADDYAPPPGPPPSQSNHGHDGYAPPTGPPPSAASAPAVATPEPHYTAPPSGPPPSHHDWQTAVPDTSLFPPTPDIFSHWDQSPANNATDAEMEAGQAWCAAHPLAPPVNVDAAAAAALAAHNPRLMQPVGFRGTMRCIARGHWELRTADGRCKDSTVFAYPPLYCASVHSPFVTGAPRTMYYEVAIRPDSRPKETSLALGFTALPYPPFRLPGWHRGSLAVHGDDGHRYANDLAGGCSFTAPFQRGRRYGIGMTFTPAAAGKMNVEVFFTKDGRREGAWDLHEETDANEDQGGVFGLEGYHDLTAAVGTFDFVSAEVIFDPAKWMYKGGQA